MPETLSLLLDSSRRWLRRHLNRESFIDALKTFVWVAPLTVLIWVYAEQEQEKDEPAVQVPVLIKSTDPNRIVTLAPGSEQWITVDLRGPRSKIEAVKSELAKGGDRGSIQIELPGNLIGNVTLATAPYVQNAALFVNNGVKALNPHPVSLGVRIDTYSDRDVPVVAQDGARIVSAVFDPRTIKVRGPTETLNAAARDGKLLAIADLTSNPELNKPGPHERVPVQVISPLESAPFVTITPRQVLATVTVQQTARQYTLDSVPVWIEGPSTFLKSVDVEYQPFVYKVTVSGPADQIQQIIDQRVIPHATLAITSDEPMNVPRSKTVDFRNLPPDVTVSQADRDKPFDYKIVPTQRQ